MKQPLTGWQSTFNLILCSFVFFSFCFCCFQVSRPATRSTQALGSLQPDLGMTKSKADFGERDGLINQSHTATSTENPRTEPTSKTLPPSRTLAAWATRVEGGVSAGVPGLPNLIVGSGAAVRREGEEGGAEERGLPTAMPSSR